MTSWVTGNKILEMRGLSTDTKPTEGILNGTVFLEMDTGKVFIFNFDSTQWIEL